MLSPLQNYFHYSRGERRGTVVLSTLVLLLVSYYFVNDWVIPQEHESTDVKAFESRIAAFEAMESDVPVPEVVTLFDFDPNQIGVEEWVALGFTDKQAAAIENYKASGATFKIKKDLLKLFMVDEQKYEQLEPYIDLPEDYPKYEATNSPSNQGKNEFVPQEVYAILLAESESPVYDGFEEFENVYYTKRDDIYQYVILSFEHQTEAEDESQKLGLKENPIILLKSTKGYYPIKKKSDNNKSDSKKKVLINLNLADTSVLKTLYGIGSGYANRIVNYRTSLGGFISLDQLEEVYGLKEETIAAILLSLTLSNEPTVRIDINVATLEELKAHPYIDWKVANSIVQIRNNYGKFASVEGIMKSVLIDEKSFHKLKPYLEAK